MNQVNVVTKRKGRKVKSIIPRSKAIILVNEGRAVFKDENTIVVPLNRERFRKFIFDRDKSICHYCGEHATTIDHLQPKSRGGCSTPVNCVCCCVSCNGEKGDMTKEEYLEFLAKKSTTA